MMNKDKYEPTRRAMLFLAERMTRKEMINNVPLFSSYTSGDVITMLKNGLTNRQILELC